MTGYSDDFSGLVSMGGDFLKLRGRLEASPFHFINLGVLAYIGTGQVLEPPMCIKVYPCWMLRPARK